MYKGKKQQTLKLNKKVQDVLIISGINPTRAYSGVKYLFRELSESYQVALWCATPNKDQNELCSWGENVHSFLDGFWGSLPKIRYLYMYLKGFTVCLRYRNKTIICHDLLHYRSCCIVKKMFPKTKLIEYFNEIYTDKSPVFQQYLAKYFEAHSSVPDYVIECNEMRRQYRIDRHKLSMPTGVILNTLPQSEIKFYRKDVVAVNNPPKIVFSGGCFGIGDLDVVINGLKKVSADFQAVLYCYGNADALEALKIQAAQKPLKGKVSVITGLGREQVLQRINSADIGIMYYDPAYSINTKYAAPTKFFEYISLGIAVVCTRNDSLIATIKNNNIGIVVDTDDIQGFSNAIEWLLQNPEEVLNMKKNAISSFDDKLCYEKQSDEAIKQIYKIVSM